MTLGLQSDIGPVQTGDTAELYSVLRIDGQPLDADQIAGVLFMVQKPDGTQVTETGVILDDGSGFLRWTDTTEVGLYLVQIQFTLTSGQIRSALTQFTVTNPFADAPMVTTVVGSGQTFPTTELTVANASAYPIPGQLAIEGVQGIVSYTGITGNTFVGCSGGSGTATPGGTVINFLTPSGTDLITEAVWARLEDLFDSIDGGPWLKDKTMYNFDENKIAMFIQEALLDINVQMPPTQYPLDFFTNWQVTPGDNPNMPILIKGVLVLTIRHLMRSYVEQPAPQGAQVVWQDRTRYTEMWSQIYQFEMQEYKESVRLWKRTTLNLGQSALSVYSKAGRLYPYGSNWASRGAYRGFY